MCRAIHRFTGKAAIYADFRPNYPEKCLNYLISACFLTAGSTVADIGAGTGIFTKLLAERGLRVTAVEPNGDMLEQARATLEGLDVTFLQNTAESTGLPDHSMELVTVAQAFHWFDQARFRDECKRILKPGGKVALVWNNRDASSDVVQESAELCRRLCPEFTGFSGGKQREAADIAGFFRNGAYELRTFPNHLSLDLKGYLGRMLSASYAPREGDAGYPAFLEENTRLFQKYQRDGRLALPNLTQSYLGEV